MLRVEQDLALAIEPERYRRWLEQASAHADAAALERARSPEAAAKLQPGRKAYGDVAVINVQGYITQKPTLLSMLFGGTSTEALAATVQAAMAEPSIGAVVLNVDSPGGEVFGVPEAADAIRASRGSKPLIAISNPYMASAAYWLGSQADEVVAIPSSLTGSIGVYSAHVDVSKALDAAGMTMTEVTYGRRKAEESEARPLTEEARAAMQKRVDYYGRMFDQAVAKGRGVSVSEVRSRFGEGAIFNAADAKAAGLVDRIATMDEVFGELASGKRPAARAEADHVEIKARRALGRIAE